MPISSEKIFKALANRQRLKILKWLKDPTAHFPPQIGGDSVKDGVCVICIAGKLGVRQPTATQHLKILVDAGLVKSKRIGQWTFIKRDESMIKRLSHLIENEI
jgi:ArsR family transcriptional regulator